MLCFGSRKGLPERGARGPRGQTMANEVELASLDLRYEGFRLKQPALEERLLSSIAQRGIQEPLEGVDLSAACPSGREGQAGLQEVKVLLNGFKRYRCARQLRLATVPYSSLGQDEAGAILSLLKTSNNRALSILEQAAFIAELKNVRGLNVAEIAAELSRSKSWVTMRLGLMVQMSEPVRQKLFTGAFPVYSYMYLTHQFMRMNGVQSRADPAVCARRQRPGFKRARGRAIGPRFFPRAGVLPAGNPQRQPGLAAGPNAPSPPKPGRVQRVRAGSAGRSGTDSEVYAAGDGQKPGARQTEQPGLSRAVPFVDRRHPEPLAGVL